MADAGLIIVRTIAFPGVSRAAELSASGNSASRHCDLLNNYQETKLNASSAKPKASLAAIALR